MKLFVSAVKVFLLFLVLMVITLALLTACAPTANDTPLVTFPKDGVKLQDGAGCTEIADSPAVPRIFECKYFDEETFSHRVVYCITSTDRYSAITCGW